MAVFHGQCVKFRLAKILVSGELGAGFQKVDSLISHYGYSDQKRTWHDPSSEAVQEQRFNRCSLERRSLEPRR